MLRERMESYSTIGAKDYRAYLESELNRSSADVNDRRSRQGQYMRMYAVALGVLLVVAGYPFQRASFSEVSDQRAYGFFGMFVLAIVLLAGCALTVFIGYNFRGILIDKKNIAALRGTMKRLVGPELPHLKLCTETDPSDVLVPRAFNTAHYWMLWPNLFVTFGSIYFLRFVCGSWASAMEVGSVLIGIVAYFYPRVCIA